MKIPGYSKLDSKNKMILSSLFFIVICAFCLVFFVLPKITDLDRIKSDIDVKRAESEIKYLHNVDVKDLFSDLKQFEQDSKKLENSYVYENRELELITMLENLAEKNNVKMKIDIASSMVAGKKIFTVQINSRGNFHDLMAYLSSIETLEYFLSINNIDMASASEVTDEIVLNFTADAYINNN